MNIKFVSHKFKAMLLTAGLIGGLIGIFDVAALSTSGQIQPETPWYCPITQVGVGESRCKARGCKKYSPEGHWVCDYQSFGGAECPPLENCELGGGN